MGVEVMNGYRNPGTDLKPEGALYISLGWLGSGGGGGGGDLGA